jgi:hypothetical protein
LEYFRFVAAVVEMLLGCEARYAIGGSFASSVYGEIRSTYDVDLTLHIPAGKVATFVKAVTARGWYVSSESVQKAVQNGGDFQVIDGEHGLKADFFVTTPTPTPRQQRTLDRARSMPYGDGEQTAMVMSPEDVILYKLEWYMLGKSEKHLRDIGAMFSDTLDFDYVDRWVHEVDADEPWQNLKRKHRKSDDQA